MSLDCETIESSESYLNLSACGNTLPTPYRRGHAGHRAACTHSAQGSLPRGRALCAGSGLWVSFAARGFGSHDRGAWGSQHLNARCPPPGWGVPGEYTSVFNVLIYLTN